MIISDLNYWEEVAEAASVVGGNSSLEVEVVDSQVTKLRSSGYKVSTHKDKSGIFITATPTSSRNSSVATTSSITSTSGYTLEDDWDIL